MGLVVSYYGPKKQEIKVQGKMLEGHYLNKNQIRDVPMCQFWPIMITKTILNIGRR